MTAAGAASNYCTDSLAFEDFNQTRVDTVRIDLDLALTFAALAESSSNPAIRKRNLQNARRAFFMIRDTLLRLCKPNASERIEIDAKLRELRLRLEDLADPRLVSAG